VITGWLKKRRRRTILEQPYPTQWEKWTAEAVPDYHELNDDEREQLRELVRVFVAEKVWEGCKGVVVTEEMKVTIAAQACLLLLGIEHEYFSNVRSILIFPRHFIPLPNEAPDDSGVVHQSSEAALGQAWENGPIILSWESSRAGGRNSEDGLNVVLHEFAHKLDLRDGLVNGTPPLNNREQHARWVEVMQREFDILVEKTEKRKATLLDKYGATDSGEFFAVSVECFFEKPTQLRQKHPDLYEVLRDYFNQNPAARSRGRID
jgi:Mlc titration factor MtfA (ptsG expression regulator)